MTLTAIVPAAGKSRRMKTSFEKPYLLLDRKPILAHALLALERSPLVRDIILVVRRSRIPLAGRLIRAFGLRKVRTICPGGPSRFESVWRGLKRLSPDTEFILVHDGARPLLSGALIQRVARAARRYGAAIPALPIHSTVKRGRGRFVKETLLRDQLWEIQTPQIFRKSLLLEGYLKAKRSRGNSVTDCAILLERLGKKVFLVPGDPRNIKITTREEWRFCESLLGSEGDKPCVWG